MESKARMIFVDNMRRYMREAKMTQSEIALRMHTPLSTISSWYNGQSYPRVDKMQSLADVLGISMHTRDKNN